MGSGRPCKAASLFFIMKKYKTRSGKIVEVRSADGVEGCLLNVEGFIGANDVTFRIYNEDKSFTDYPIRHADPKIKFIDSGIYFYSDGRNTWLDHSPDALGLEEIE